MPMLLGSLPYQNPGQALALVRRYSGMLVAWPQLPQRSIREHNILQAVSGFPGLQVDQASGSVVVNRALADHTLDRLSLAYLAHDSSYAALGAEQAAGLAELTYQRDSLRGVLALKGQLLGPISLALILTDEHQRPLIYDERFLDALVQYLHLRAAWQSAYLAELGPATIICVDEPFLDAVAYPFLPVSWEQACLQINAVLAGIDGCRALFIGGVVHWEHVFATNAELIITDLQQNMATLSAAGAAVAAFVHAGGMVGLGVIPGDPGVLLHATPVSLVAQIEALIQALQPHGLAADQLLRHAILTTTDSLGWVSFEDAERAMELLAATSALVRERYQLH